MAARTTLGARVERLDEIHRTFALFDRDGDGRISADELGEVLRALGQPVTDAELRAMIATVDLDGSGTIEINEFRALFLPQEPSLDATMGDEDLRSAFSDFDRDGDGQISVAELRRALRALGEDVDAEGIEAMVHQADADGDGQVNYEEFARIMVEGWGPRGQDA